MKIKPGQKWQRLRLHYDGHFIVEIVRKEMYKFIVNVVSSRRNGIDDVYLAKDLSAIGLPESDNPLETSNLYWQYLEG